MTGYVILHGQAVRSLDLPSDPRYIETDPDIKYGIYAPIVIDERLKEPSALKARTMHFGV